MRPDGWKAFGGGGDTSLHPLVLIVLTAGILLMWILPRRHMLKPFIACAILIPQEQLVVVMGLHFMALRILIAGAWTRFVPALWTGRRLPVAPLRATDLVLVAWAVWGAVAYALLWGDFAALLPKLGFLYNAAGTYFLVRHIIRDQSDVDRTVRLFAVICTALAVLMIVEHASGRNVLSVVGTPEFADVRQGRIRAQASFAHPLIAGTFGAILLPIFFTYCLVGRSLLFAVSGLLAAAVMVGTSSSSTPVGAAVAGVVAICLWPVRKHMRAIRWAALTIVLLLHLSMNAPVWALLGRIRIVSASTSWHRYELVNQCINRIWEWWLFGTRDTESWGWDLWDTANWYVSCATSGGLVGLLLFLALMAVSFRSIGAALRTTGRDLPSSRIAWGFGATLVASAVAFVGVELFDQSVVLWYAVLAIIGALPVLSVHNPRNIPAPDQRCNTPDPWRLEVQQWPSHRMY